MPKERCETTFQPLDTDAFICELDRDHEGAHKAGGLIEVFHEGLNLKLYGWWEFSFDFTSKDYIQRPTERRK